MDHFFNSLCARFPYLLPVMHAFPKGSRRSPRQFTLRTCLLAHADRRSFSHAGAV